MKRARWLTYVIPAKPNWKYRYFQLRSKLEFDGVFVERQDHRRPTSTHRLILLEILVFPVNLMVKLLLDISSFSKLKAYKI